MLTRVLAVATVLLAAGCSQKECPPPAAHAPPSGAPAGGTITLAPAANPVQAEMRLLAAAMETAVRGIGTGDVSEVQHALHRVHAAKDATGQAIKDGWRPAVNGDQIDAFVAMDEAFHAHLADMVRASQRADVPAMATAVSAAVQGCHGCHAMFRAPAAGAPPAAPPAAPTAPAPAPAPAHDHHDH